VSQDERVLVVPSAEFDRLGRFQGFSPKVAHYLEALLAPGVASFAARGDVENDPNFKQIIPYIIFRLEGLTFNYRRMDKSGEKRLYGQKSIGVGGHVNDSDSVEGDFLATYKAGLRREVREEMGGDQLTNIGLEKTPIGLVNDDSTAVGRVHLGVVHVCSLTESTPEQLRNTQLARGSLAGDWFLQKYYLEYEAWSQICISPARFLGSSEVDKPVWSYNEE
jgi:predicted NUDIX family phosphoesterase